LAAQLADGLLAVERPGAAASWHSHWVFPILHPRADALIAHLQSRGFDATRGTSSMSVVTGTQADMRAAKAEQVFAHQCYLPAHEGMSARDIERLATALQEFDAGVMTGDWRAA
jgi:dTDP-4-amino-4,6-dideoxygalactose transaminase